MAISNLKYLPLRRGISWNEIGEFCCYKDKFLFVTFTSLILGQQKSYGQQTIIDKQQIWVSMAEFIFETFEVNTYSSNVNLW